MAIVFRLKTMVTLVNCTCQRFIKLISGYNISVDLGIVDHINLSIL